MDHFCSAMQLVCAMSSKHTLLAAAVQPVTARPSHMSGSMGHAQSKIKQLQVILGAVIAWQLQRCVMAYQNCIGLMKVLFALCCMCLVFVARLQTAQKAVTGQLPR